MPKLKPCPFCGSKAIIKIIPPHTHKIATFMPDYGGKKKYPCGMCQKLPRFCKDRDCKTCTLNETGKKLPEMKERNKDGAK